MFGGVYLWAAALLCVVLLALGALTLSHVFPREDPWLRRLDLALVALLAGVLLQIAPLPAALVRLLSPARDAFMTAVALDTSRMSGYATLSLDPSATGHACLALFCVLLTFWIARAVFERGGLRTFGRTIAWGSIALAVAAFVQQASGTPLVYGVWQPRDAGSRPLGPFINRNHFGTWGVMAICLCAGYLRWKQDGLRPSGGWGGRIAAAMDARRIVLLLAVVLLAIVLSRGASRSALVALACAAGYVAFTAPPGRRRRGPLAAVAAAAVLSMVGWGDGQRLLLRMDETRTAGMGNRLAIWRDTVALVGDFPAAGVGAGAFGTAMRVYQTTPRTYYHNEAHNQYLQLLSEGGVLLTLPAAAAIVSLIAAAGARLRRRDDPLQWMRVAAAGGLVGAAVQSIWETGLTLPANGMLAAALAALLVHQPAGTLRQPTAAAGGRR